MGDSYYPAAYGGGQLDFSGIQQAAKGIAGGLTDMWDRQSLQRAVEGAGGDFNKLYQDLLAAGHVKEAASVAQMLESQAMAGYRNRMLDATEANRGVPSGYQKTPEGNLTFIPGGPEDPEVQRGQPSRIHTPPGYAWNDPTNPEAGMHAIAGGPGEKVDAEVAGRLGLAKSFIGQAPALRERILNGEASGFTGNLEGAIGKGGPGEIRRQLDSGADSLLRMLTGAGMNQAEATDYVRRYRFDVTDGIETRVSKLDQLVRELQSVGETVGRGRGGIDLSLPATAPTPTDAPEPTPTSNIAPIPGANYITSNPEGALPLRPTGNTRTAPTPEKAQQMRAWAKEALDAGVPREMVVKRMQELGYGL
jgi:hypothetical protein